MRDNDDLTNIPPLVPDRDDVNSHHNTRRAQSRDIVRPNSQGQAGARKSWLVPALLALLTLAVAAGAYGGYRFWDIYQTDLRQANLRISDLETRLNIVDQDAEESDNSLMEDINQTIEQYDLLWANWRNNNRQFDEIQSELARLKMVNEGQDEATSNNSQILANNSDALNAANTRLNALGNELQSLTQSVTTLDAELAELEGVRSDIESMRQSLSSGDGSVGGLVGRLQYLEESMESVNAHRLQINESLFRLQESLESMQRSMN